MVVFTPTSETVRLYEVIILLPNLSEGDLLQALRSMELLFTEKGGKQLHKDPWGRQGLAYRIRGHQEGQYVVYLYELSPDSMQAIDAALRLEKGVLRHLLVKVPKHYDVTTFAERFALWKKEEEQQKVLQESKQEEAMKWRIAQRTAKAAAPKVELKPGAPVEGKALEEELSKLISDEDLHL